MVKVFQGKKEEAFADAYYVRKTVFMDEQGFSYELDDIDEYATHAVLYIDNKPIAAGRIFEQNGSYHIGRICVLKPYRHQNYASKIMDALEAYGFEKTNEIVLSAQCHAKGFYEKRGYMSYGEEYLDEFCPHVDMKKTKEVQ